MLGNDLVDLAEARALRKASDARWCARVFTAEENERIDRADDRELELWKLWAAKESLYKALVKQGLERRGSWKNLDVLSWMSAVRIAWEVTSDWLHCVVSDVEEVCAEVRRGDSALGREALRTAIRPTAPHLVEIVREQVEGRSGPPFARVAGKRATEWDLSLSHDGPWVAHALVFRGRKVGGFEPRSATGPPPEVLRAWLDSLLVPRAAARCVEKRGRDGPGAAQVP